MLNARKNYATMEILRLISTDAFLATHVNARKFNHINKIEAGYKVLRLKVKLNEVLLLRLRATFHAVPLFYLRTDMLRNVRT